MGLMGRAVAGARRRPLAPARRRASTCSSCASRSTSSSSRGPGRTAARRVVAVRPNLRPVDRRRLVGPRGRRLPRAARGRDLGLRHGGGRRRRSSRSSARACWGRLDAEPRVSGGEPRRQVRAARSAAAGEARDQRVRRGGAGGRRVTPAWAPATSPPASCRHGGRCAPSARLAGRPGRPPPRPRLPGGLRRVPPRGDAAVRPVRAGLAARCGPPGGRAGRDAVRRAAPPRPAGVVRARTAASSATRSTPSSTRASAAWPCRSARRWRRAGARPSIGGDAARPRAVHAARRAARGYDQAELLARAAATRLGLPVRSRPCAASRATVAPVRAGARPPGRQRGRGVRRRPGPAGRVAGSLGGARRRRRHDRRHAGRLRRGAARRRCGGRLGAHRRARSVTGWRRPACRVGPPYTRCDRASHRPPHPRCRPARTHPGGLP